MPTPADNLAGIFLADGWWFPGGCVGGRHQKYLAHENDVIPAVRRLPNKRRRTCIQAGGNVGLFPVTLARYFQHVVTFEPDAANWQCLVRNIAARPQQAERIQSYQAALGERLGVGTLLFNEKNPNGHKFRYGGDPVRENHERFTPIDGFPVMTIDQLALSDVDLIALDIEGAEWPALRGASKTIEKSRPLILIEQRGHGEFHGYDDQDLAKWLRHLGYRNVGKVAKDQLWTP